jgi:hypothetical protein
MWALIKDNKIEQIYQRPKSLVIGLNILHKLHILGVLLIKK